MNKFTNKQKAFKYSSITKAKSQRFIIMSRGSGDTEGIVKAVRRISQSAAGSGSVHTSGMFSPHPGIRRIGGFFMLSTQSGVVHWSQGKRNKRAAQGHSPSFAEQEIYHVSCMKKAFTSGVSDGQTLLPTGVNLRFSGSIH